MDKLKNLLQTIFRYDRRVSGYRLTVGRGYRVYAAPGPYRVSWEVRSPSGEVRTKHVDSQFGYVWYTPDHVEVRYEAATPFRRLVRANSEWQAYQMAKKLRSSEDAERERAAFEAQASSLDAAELNECFRLEAVRGGEVIRQSLESQATQQEQNPQPQEPE